MTKALILDDERDICELIEMSLMGQDITCTSVYTIRAAIKALKEERYSFVISDIRLPDGDGLDFLAHIQKNYPGLPVCMITAHGNMDTAIRALKLGAFDFINKPFDLKQLRNVCKAALKEGHGQLGGGNAGGSSAAPGKKAAGRWSLQQQIRTHRRRRRHAKSTRHDQQSRALPGPRLHPRRIRYR